MKKIISLILALVLCAALAVPTFAEKTVSLGYTVTTFEELEEYIEELEDHCILDLTIANDIVFEDEIDIEAEDVDIYFHGPATLLLPGEQGFCVNDINVRLFFDKVTIKGTDTYLGDGQGITVDADYCTISGARFETCGSHKKGEMDYGLIDWSGGAINVDGESCTIKHCDFIGCRAMTDGAAIYIDDEHCVVSDCYFEGCSAMGDFGGAIYVCVEQSDAQIINCKFKNCGDRSAASGKNVYARGYAAVIDPHPYSEDTNLYRGCALSYTGEPFRPMNVVDIADGDYIIASALDLDKCLNIAGGEDGQSNGDHLQLGTMGTDTGNIFTIKKDVSTGAYSIKAKHSGLMLSVEDDSPLSGKTILQWEDYGNPGQRWIFEDAGDGYVCIRSLLGNYADVLAGSTADGTSILSFRDLGTDGQRFKLEKAGFFVWWSASVLSNGSVWIVASVAAAAVLAVAVLVIVKKKKPAPADSEN